MLLVAHEEISHGQRTGAICNRSYWGKDYKNQMQLFLLLYVIAYIFVAYILLLPVCDGPNYYV